MLIRIQETKWMRIRIQRKSEFGIAALRNKSTWPRYRYSKNIFMFRKTDQQPFFFPNSLLLPSLLVMNYKIWIIATQYIFYIWYSTFPAPAFWPGHKILQIHYVYNYLAIKTLNNVRFLSRMRIRIPSGLVRSAIFGQDLIPDSALSEKIYAKH